MKRAIATLCMLCLSIGSAAAQASKFAPLQSDGNGIEVLQQRYFIAFSGSAADGLRMVGRRAQLDLSFDESLPGLSAAVTLPDSAMSAAAAILRLADAANLEARVSSSGQIIVVRRTAKPTTKRLTGFVNDSASGEPLGDVRISVQGSTDYTATRSDGSFSLLLRGQEASALSFMRIGYKPQRITVDGSSPVTIRLVQSVVPLAAVRISPGQFGVMEQGSGSGHSLSREQIQTSPQLGEDVFRAVNRLPGLAANDLSAKFYVRGGSGDELYVSLDGAELYEPFHLKDIDAALSIIDVESIGGIDLSTGGFSAEYGDRLTGVFRMSSVEPRTDAPRNALGLSVTNARAMSQGSFAAGKGGWIVSARRGYLDLALKLSNAGDSLSPRYYDVFAKVQYDLSPTQRISFHVLDATDKLKYLTDRDPSLQSDYGSRYVWAKWDAGMGARFSSSLVASGGRLTWSRSGERLVQDSISQLKVHDARSFSFASLKGSASYSLSDFVLLRAGGEIKNENAEYDYLRLVRGNSRVDAEQNFFVDTTAFNDSPSGSSQNLFVIARGGSPRLVFEAGARLDHQSRYVGETEISPRLSAAWQPFARTTLRAAWGHYFQSQPLYGLQVQDGVRAYAPAERAEHRTVAVEQGLFGLSARTELYLRKLTRQRPRYLNALNSLDVFPEAGDDRTLLIAPTGEARGMELRVNPARRGLFDWSATYALARVFDRVGSRDIPRAVDQRHTVSLDASRRGLSGKWMISAAWLYHSGWPYTPTYFRADTVISNTNTLLVNISGKFGELNSGRLPPYHRIDFRATRYFEVRGGRLAVFFDVFNALNRDNARGYGYDLKFQPLRIERVIDGQVSMLPTAGVTWEF